MASFSLPPPGSDSHGIHPLILCSYRNSTNRMVVVRARGMEAFFLERVVFPFEIMTFHCPRDGEVEVIMRTQAGKEESEWVSAEQLLAGDSDPELQEDWRPHRNSRGVSVRSNASNICLDGLYGAPHMATGHEQPGGGAREEARGTSVPLERVPGCLSFAADGPATGPLAARH